MRQAEDTGGLVEGFPRGIVNGATDAGETVVGFHDQELAMPAGDEKHQVGIGQIIGQARRQCVARQMVHPDQRQPCRRRQPLGAHHAGKDPADQPRPGGDSDAVQVTQRDPGFGQSLLHTDIQFLGMSTGGDFRHHPAEIGMERRLPFHD